VVAWVVDNASSDGSAQMVRDEFPWARLSALDDNVGFGAAVNLVAREAATPWIGAANADVALRPGALEALLAAGREDAGAGLLAPRLLLPDGSTQHSVFAFPTIGLAALIASGLGYAVRPLGRRRLLYGRVDWDQARRVPWAVGAFVLVRREAWDAVGGFDEQQWMYAEDLDLGWRLARAGWATRYEPRALVDHESSAATAQAWGDGRTERWQRASYAWMLRRRGRARTRVFAATMAAGSATRWALFGAAALVAPARFATRRDAARAWARLHRMGLGR
jgi:GT2 family glycosyltransferase